MWVLCPLLLPLWAGAVISITPPTQLYLLKPHEEHFWQKMQLHWIFNSASHFISQAISLNLSSPVGDCCSESRDAVRVHRWSFTADMKLLSKVINGILLI